MRKPLFHHLKRLRAGPLQQRLLLIVLVGLLPLAVLAFATLISNADKQRLDLLDAAEDRMRAVLAVIDTEIELSIASLDALAASARLQAGDVAEFRGEAHEVLARRPSWANMVLSTPAASQVVNLRAPANASLPRQIVPEIVAAVRQTGRPAVSGVVAGPFTTGFVVAVPVKRGNEVQYVLSAVVRPDALRDLLGRQRLPQDGVVARSRAHEERAGKPGSPGIVALLAKGEPGGWAITRTLEGVPAYSVYQRSPLTGWAAAIGIPTEVLDAPVRRSYAMLGGALLLSVLLGVLAALLAARSITAPMAALERAAGAMRRGARPEISKTRLPEVRKAAEALAAAHDEREQLLQGEREARRAAERANRAKDEFLAMLGHELRNPLAAIGSAAEVLVAAPGKLPPEAAGQAVDIIERQVKHVARLTDDLLDAARVMMGKIVLQRTPVDLAEVAERAIATVKGSGRLAQHRLVVQAESVWVSGDATRLEQVISNLLVNAVKYTPQGSTIEVRVAPQGEEALLRVRDEGIGIDAALLPRVFELFVQGERPLDRSLGGLGIGLTLVHRLVELHGGSVTAASAGTGQGAEFTIRLPARLPALAEAPAPGVQRAGAQEARRRIVLVEDNADARASLRLLLESYGHEVHEAAEGPAGIAAILRERPHIALIDIGLPGLDGYQVAARVRAQLGAGMRLVALTGYGQREDQERAARAGFDAHLVKPVDAAALHAVLSA